MGFRTQASKRGRRNLPVNQPLIGLGSRRTRQTLDITGNIVSGNSCSYCSDRQHRHSQRIGMKDELVRLLPHEDLPNSVVLILQTNKTPAEIIDALSLHSIKNNDWYIQACCARTGEGLYDGLGWIAQRVTGKATS
ncbi:ADP-ribosylation factor-like protein 5 [Camellia lanceoleosa]|uniref:ADP-ribosylation factor-like protein 5 n=1 Tax=Camellia lanceoleosa TaxID=1840588 RepID=A0ACC0GU61_9ERIC|nr:ADP-ribosylation factor-like protein 5 [Camellia lanceoleosa]